MPLYSRDMEKIEKSASEPGLHTNPFFLNPILFLLRCISKIPWLKKYMKDTVGGLSGTIFRLWRTNEYERAAETAIYALEKYRNVKNEENHHVWWGFMKLATQSLENSESETLKHDVISLAQNGIRPFDGFDVAYSFAQFSRWKYRAGDYDTAMEFARIASQADETWPEADFLLGWYTLVRGVGDAMSHFEGAIKKDSRIITLVLNDPICRKHPDIIDKLTLMTTEQIYERSD